MSLTPQPGARSCTRRLVLAASVTAPVGLAAAERSAPLNFTYLGNAGWRIDDGRTVILVDPFVTEFRKDGNDSSKTDADEIAPDERLIAAHIPRADFILITHSHVDHMLDAPAIAKRTGAVILGSEGTGALARVNGVPEKQIIIAKGGEDLEFGAFSVRVIPSLHSELYAKHYNNTPVSEPVPRNLSLPLHVSAYREGGTFAYLLRLAGHRILIMGGMNYIEREMQGLQADIAIVGAAASHKEIYRYSARLMQALGYPKVVFPTHWDAYGEAASAAAQARAEDFTREIKAASPATRVIVPAYFVPVPVR